jgi:hypothetical protein
VIASSSTHSGKESNFLQEVSWTLYEHIQRRLEQFLYYPTYPKGKLRLRRVVRNIILAKRLEELGAINAVIRLRELELDNMLDPPDPDRPGPPDLKPWDVKWRDKGRFFEIARAVLMETKAAKKLERYSEALKVVEMIREILPGLI